MPPNAPSMGARPIPAPAPVASQGASAGASSEASQQAQWALQTWNAQLQMRHRAKLLLESRLERGSLTFEESKELRRSLAALIATLSAHP